MIDELKEIEKLKKYWTEFYKLYDTLPVDLKIKLMEQEKMPIKIDVVNAIENKELEDLFNDF